MTASPHPLLRVPRFVFTVRLALLCVGVGCGTSALAQSVEPPKSPVAPQRVEITTQQASDDRKDANAAKTVVLRDDLARFNDASLGQMLARVPGVVVIGAGSQAREITMRGLGGGYTQILINGEPVPPGFSLDSIAPDLIERIEVIRSATADASTQAIAGSINIVLRRAAATGQHEVKLSASTYGGLGSTGLTSQYGNKVGAVSYSIASSANFERDAWRSSVTTSAFDASGRPVYRHEGPSVERGTKFTLGVSPRAVYKPDDSKSLTVDGLLQWQRFDYVGNDTRRPVFGDRPAFDYNDMSFVTDTLQARVGVAGKTRLGDDGTLELKLNGTLFRRRLDFVFDGYQAGVQQVARTLGSDLQDTSSSLVGKYSLGLTNAHTLGSGWDIQSGRRSEDRIQRETSTSGAATLNLDEDYVATVNRLAFYLQDEWTVSPALSGYFGVRWEALETRTRGATLTPLRKRATVLSPTMQWLWKVPETKGDQVRLAIGRTYKAPTARDLIPRRWVVADNAATSPNFQGNPALEPELAWGVDLGYERYLGRDIFVGANVYARNIQNVILTQVFQAADGTWISTPVNSGGALVLGLELETKAKLNQVFAALPDIDVRAGLGVNRSRVAAVPGPGNRLSRQPPLTASLGMDYRMVGAPLTLGGSFNFEKQELVRTSATQSQRLAGKRGLDLYGLWRVGPTLNVRATMTNLLQPDAGAFNVYDDGNFRQERAFTLQSFRTFRLSLEFKL